MFERFTDRSRRAVVLAQEEARGLKHNYIGTEHLLLGLVHEGEGLAAKVLADAGFSLDGCRGMVLGFVGEGMATPQGHISFTPRAKRVCELALRESLQLGHNYIGTEHILLGLLREGEGVAVQIIERVIPPISLGARVLELMRQGADQVSPVTLMSTGAAPFTYVNLAHECCLVCGAVVGNKELHQKWHEQGDQRVE